MPTVQVMSAVEIELEQVLDSVAELELSELEKFAAEVNGLLARRKRLGSPTKERELLDAIEQRPSPKVRQRYTLLNQKLQDESLTDKEHAELVELVEQIEAFDVKRLKNLIELAQLRGISLDEVMDQLEIQRSIYA
jgi:hypothetical protein